MYVFIEFLVAGLCIVGIIYMICMKNKYKNDTSSSKEDIIKYFEEKNATSIESGIKTKELPKDILKNPYLLMMVQNKILSFKKGKYYLNK